MKFVFDELVDFNSQWRQFKVFTGPFLDYLFAFQKTVSVRNA